MLTLIIIKLRFMFRRITSPASTHTRVFISTPWSVIRLCPSRDLSKFVCLALVLAATSSLVLSGGHCVANKTLGHGHWTHFRTMLRLNKFSCSTPSRLYPPCLDCLAFRWNTKLERTYPRDFFYFILRSYSNTSS